MRAESGPAVDAGPDLAALQAALDRVIDPELDESLVRLGFVERLEIEAGRVLVELRLPTFWCAPNFAYLMARDARDRLRAVEGVEKVEVMLKDHFASEEISQAATNGRPFGETFGSEADGNLD